ncbi:hypothetical protein D3C86_1437910 [compost metagenome]
MASQAVSAAIGSVAASSGLKLAGLLIKAASGTQMYAENTPGASTPRRFSNPSGFNSPDSHPGVKWVVTRSPGRNRLTLVPVRTTVPEASEPGI